MMQKYKLAEGPKVINCTVIATWNTGLIEEITTGSNQILDTFLETVEYTEKEDNWNLCEGCFEYVHEDYTYSDEQPWCPDCATSPCCSAEIIVDHNICKSCKEHI